MSTAVVDQMPIGSEQRRTGRGVVVTGAAQGLGKAIAATLAQDGMAVVAVDLSPSVEALTADLGPGHGAIVGDACAPDVVDRACRLAAELGEGCASVVLNAGVVAAGESVDFPPSEWDRVLDVNLRGVFTGAQASRPHLQAGASIVMLSSICATQGFGARAAYCASKAGVEGLVRALAREWGPDGVRVNAVAPGTIATDMLKGMLASGRSSTELYRARIPMQRLGDPSEIGNAVSFLLSDKASYITGAVLPVDGGWASAGLPASSGS